MAPLQRVPADRRARRASAWWQRQAHRWDVAKVAYCPRNDAAQQVRWALAPSDGAWLSHADA